VIGGYGPVWFPRGIAVGWAPYRFGHWVFILPWGWTWIDAAPWGFAPFHYGRWAFIGNTWGWVPGPIVSGVQPVYAPALVAWIGGGPGFNFSATFGIGDGVAWFPLGPREVFVPAYHVSDEYVTRINIADTSVDRTTVLNIYHRPDAWHVDYVNERVGGAVTVVNRDTFVGGRAVESNVVNVSDRNIANAPVYHGGPEVQPERASMTGEAGSAHGRPPAVVENRTVIAERTPPHRSSLPQQNNASNAGGGQEANGSNPQPGKPADAGYHRFGENSGGNANNSNAPGGQPNSNNRGQGETNPPAARNENNNPPPSQPNPPSVRQAPPVRQPTPEEQQNDQNKQQQWQNQHQQVHGSQPPATGTTSGNENTSHNSGGNAGGSQENRGSRNSSKPPHR